VFVRKIRKELTITRFQKWVHRRCSGVKESLYKVNTYFYMQELHSRKTDSSYGYGNEQLDIGSGALLEKVDKFCFLGDVLDADGGCDSAVMTRDMCVKKFQEYLPILTGKGFSL